MDSSHQKAGRCENKVISHVPPFLSLREGRAFLNETHVFISPPTLLPIYHNLSQHQPDLQYDSFSFNHPNHHKSQSPIPDFCHRHTKNTFDLILPHQFVASTERINSFDDCAPLVARRQAEKARHASTPQRRIQRVLQAFACIDLISLASSLIPTNLILQILLCVLTFT